MLSDLRKPPAESDVQLDEKLLTVEHRSSILRGVNEAGKRTEQDLPFPELFLDDVSSSQMNDDEMYLAKNYAGLIFGEQEIWLLSEGKEDVAPFVRYLANYMSSHINFSKGRKGVQVKDVKSLRYIGQEEHKITPLEEEKKKGLSFM
jgi:hypothetical protein